MICRHNRDAFNAAPLVTIIASGRVKGSVVMESEKEYQRLAMNVPSSVKQAFNRKMIASKAARRTSEGFVHFVIPFIVHVASSFHPGDRSPIFSDYWNSTWCGRIALYPVRMVRLSVRESMLPFDRRVRNLS